jgi:hypothetical protein
LRRMCIAEVNLRDERGHVSGLIYGEAVTFCA